MSRTKLVAALSVTALSYVVVIAIAGAAAQSDKGRLAFRRYFDSQQSWGAVFTANYDGKGARQITRPPRGTVDDQPRWAPDGSLITFDRVSGETSHVWVVKPDGTGLAPVGPLCPVGADAQACPDDASASFSPDSKQIVFTQATGRVKSDSTGEDWIEHSAVAVMNVDGSGRRVIYQGTPFSGDLNAPAFSPNGRRLVFERAVSGFSTPAHHKALFVVDADGTHVRQLTPWAENDGDHPAWSPNGRWIIYHSHIDDPSGQPQIFLVHPDGTGRRQLTHFPAGTWVGRSGFSPDSASIVFAHGRDGGNVDVFTMRLDGTGVRRITHSPLWDSAPDWGRNG
jgi:TolB protein